MKQNQTVAANFDIKVWSVKPKFGNKKLAALVIRFSQVLYSHLDPPSLVQNHPNLESAIELLFLLFTFSHFGQQELAIQSELGLQPRVNGLNAV